MMKRCFALLIAVLLVACTMLPAAADDTAIYVGVKNDSPTGAQYLLEDCEETDGWFTSHGTISEDREEGTEGGASVAVTADIDAYCNQSWTINGRFETRDLTLVDMISFDIHISDLSVIDAAYQVTASLASGGANSNKTLTWQAAMMTMTYTENEWIHVELPLSQATHEGINLSEANVFRLKFRRLSPAEKLEDVTIRVDNICAESYPTKAVMLLDCDDTTLWNGAEYDGVNHKQGFGCVVFRSTTLAMEEGDHNMVKQAVLSTPVDARNADYLEMDIYVSDANAIQEHTSQYGLHIEITSSGTCDREEYEFYPKNFASGLKDGWNHLRLPISSAGITGGTCDLRRVNYFRIHLLNLHTAKNNELILKLDNIYLSVVQDGVEDYPEDVTPPAGGENTPPTGEDNPPPTGGEENTPPTGEDPVPPTGETPAPGTENEQPSEDDTAAQAALRKRLTAQRARIVVLLFAFVILGADIVAVALRRRNDAAALAVADGQLEQALDASEPIPPTPTEAENPAEPQEGTDNEPSEQ
ncbi:MAG: hypothetical protein IJW97_02580 [Clostridia bacterium]|nr:hypothetical protein [Clostridia bacterium]